MQLSDLTSLYTSWSIHRKCCSHLSRYITIMISSLHISLTALITTLNGQFFDMCIILPTRTKASRRQASCQSCLPLQSHTLCNALEIYWDEYADYPYFTDKEKMKKACDLPKVHGQWAAGTESLTIPSKGVLWFRVTYTFRLPPDKQWKVIFLESILYRKHKNPLLSLTTKTEWLCNTSSPAALLIFHTIKCY